VRIKRNNVINSSVKDFPGGLVFKNLPVNAGNIGSIPCPGISHMPQGN